MAMPTFERRVSKETIGCPKPFNACADPVVCNGMGLYLQVAGECRQRGLLVVWRMLRCRALSSWKSPAI